MRCDSGLRPASATRPIKPTHRDSLTLSRYNHVMRQSRCKVSRETFRTKHPHTGNSSAFSAKLPHLTSSTKSQIHQCNHSKMPLVNRPIGGPRLFCREFLIARCIFFAFHYITQATRRMQLTLTLNDSCEFYLQYNFCIHLISLFFMTEMFMSVIITDVFRLAVFALTP